MPVGRRVLLLMAVAIFPHLSAAQTVPSSGEVPPQTSAAPPWPGEPGSSVGASPLTGGGMGGGARPCMAEFTKLREDVEQKGIAAKAAGQNKVAREEMCKYVTTYAEAEAKWVRYSESNVQICGIPVQVVNQLKQVHVNTEQTRQRICAAGPAAPTPGPARGPIID